MEEKKHLVSEAMYKEWERVVESIKLDNVKLRQELKAKFEEIIRLREELKNQGNQEQ